MLRPLCYGAVMLAMLSANLSAQRPPAHAGPKGAEPGAGAKKGNRNIVDKWNRMSPDERQKALERLPPERRKRIEEHLNRYRNLSPQERRQLSDRYQMFKQLPPEKQNEARRVFRQFGELPPERQGMVRQEFQNLRSMSEEDRRTRINSDEFRGKYDRREQKILGDLSGLVGSAR